MSKFEGVTDTLYIPLTARIYVSEHFPEYFNAARHLLRAGLQSVYGRAG